MKKVLFSLILVFVAAISVNAQSLNGSLKKGKVVSSQLYLNEYETPVYMIKDLSTGKLLKAVINENNINEGDGVVYIEDVSQKCDRGNAVRSNQEATYQTNAAALNASTVQQQQTVNAVGGAIGSIGEAVGGAVILGVCAHVMEVLSGL